MNTLQSLKKKADKLLQEVYVPRNPICLVCGGKTSEMHHYIQKTQSDNLRYNPKNLVPLCRTCHARHHLSGDPKIVATILSKKGLRWNTYLQNRRKGAKLTVKTIKSIIADLEIQSQQNFHYHFSW